MRSDPVTAEDAKLIILARGARARIGADQGAAVRDDMGRSYAAPSIALATVRIDALPFAVAQAAAAGAGGLEAAVVVSATRPKHIAVVGDLGGAPVLWCDLDGTVREMLPGDRA